MKSGGRLLYQLREGAIEDFLQQQMMEHKGGIQQNPCRYTLPMTFSFLIRFEGYMLYQEKRYLVFYLYR